MKKFLSILLAVMMVLSTVSFAAPSLAGSADTAVEAPVAEVPVFEEETADLAAVAGDKTSYGTLVYSIDFERDDFDVSKFSAAYAQLDDNPITAYMNPAFDLGNATAYSNASDDGFTNAALATEGTNTYITGNVTAGYNGFFRMTKYNCTWPEGYYTFAVDIKIPAGQVDSFAQQCNDTAIALTQLRAFDKTNGDWQTVVNQTTNVVNGSDIYGFFVTPNNATAGTVSYDNWEVYYRPATVTLTIDGNEYEVSTAAPVTAASLASQVKAPTGYVLSGLSLTEGGELLTGERYFFEDTTLYPTYAKDPNVDPTYGKALFVVDFENEVAQNWWGHSYHDNSVCSAGGWIYEVASYYDSRFEGKNYRIRFLINEATHTDQVTVADASGNHYTKGTAVSKWPQVLVPNWGDVQGEAGIYTFVVDTMTDTAVENFAYNTAWTAVDPFSKEVGVWDTVAVQQTMTEAGKLVSGEPIVNYSFAAEGATISFDNAKLFYKPLTADVTLLYKGEEYLAEDVSTAGVSADTIVAASGLEIPYGKKAVLSATNGGESVGNTINLVMDSTYYVSFVDDDSISEYGKRLFLVDFEDLTSISDNAPLSNSTSNYNGDWGHLTIDYQVGSNTLVEEDGNKIIKGCQGWAQIRINNANYASAPAGYYTMALRVKNYGAEEKFLSSKDQGGTDETATWLTGSVAGTKDNHPIVNGVWNDVAAQLDFASQDFTIYHTADMTTEVGFDDIALYYRPASVNLTVVGIDGEETVYENCDSVVDIDTLLADVTAPFGYKAALSIEKNGDPISGSINLVSDAKLYVVLTPDETVSMEYGKALFIIDFEREDMQGWAGTTIDVANSDVSNGAYVYTTASYYNDIFQNKNYRVRFVVNEGTLTDQKTVVDENGNHYTEGTATTKWPQVYQSNYDQVQYKAGYYTFMVDAKTTVAPDGYGFGAWTKPEGFSVPVNEWYTITGTQELTADGALHPAGTGGVWFNYSYTDDQIAAGVKVSWDNAKLFYKPYTATVELLANGAVVATKENVSTAGVLVSTLVDGVKVKGYSVTGVKLGATVYGLEDTIKVPCDCQLELALEEQAFNPATPETSAEKSIRTSGDPSGIRFKASLTKVDNTESTEYGWIVTREELLNDAGIAAADFTLDSDVNMSKGWNYDSAKNIEKIFLQDDEYTWFTAILYFSVTEDDGLPSADKLAGKLVARPFVKTGDGEYLYGEPTAPASMYDVAYAIWEDGEAWDDLDGDAQTYLDDIMIKVEDAGLGN